MNTIPLHIRNFNDKVRLMNQTNAKQLTVSAADARNLHAEIYALMTEITRLNLELERKIEASVTAVTMDGGGFS